MVVAGAVVVEAGAGVFAGEGGFGVVAAAGVDVGAEGDAFAADAGEVVEELGLAARVGVVGLDEAAGRAGQSDRAVVKVGEGVVGWTDGSHHGKSPVESTAASIPRRGIDLNEKILKRSGWDSLRRRLRRRTHSLLPAHEKTPASCEGFSSGEGGIRTRDRGLNPYDGLANRCLQPLGHLSGVCRAGQNSIG